MYEKREEVIDYRPGVDFGGRRPALGGRAKRRIIGKSVRDRL
jgi:hypothetical protein